MELWANWARLPRRDTGPAGWLSVRWWHPATAGIAVGRLDRLWAAGRESMARRRPAPGTPVQVAEHSHEGVVEGRPATRSWAWAAGGVALFAADPDRLADELRVRGGRRPAGGAWSPERQWL